MEGSPFVSWSALTIQQPGQRAMRYVEVLWPFELPAKWEKKEQNWTNMNTYMKKDETSKWK